MCLFRREKGRLSGVPGINATDYVTGWAEPGLWLAQSFWGVIPGSRTRHYSQKAIPLSQFWNSIKLIFSLCRKSGSCRPEGVCGWRCDSGCIVSCPSSIGGKTDSLLSSRHLPSANSSLLTLGKLSHIRAGKKFCLENSAEMVSDILSLNAIRSHPDQYQAMPQLAYWLSVSQGASLGDLLLAPVCPV